LIFQIPASLVDPAVYTFLTINSHELKKNDLLKYLWI
jgi:hypothetical protein